MTVHERFETRVVSDWSRRCSSHPTDSHRPSRPSHIYRAVVAVLGITVIATVFAGLYLATKADANIKLPDAIVAIGSAAVGALADLLAPSPTKSD